MVKLLCGDKIKNNKERTLSRRKTKLSNRFNHFDERMSKQLSWTMSVH